MIKYQIKSNSNKSHTVECDTVKIHDSGSVSFTGSDENGFCVFVAYFKDPISVVKVDAALAALEGK